MDYFDEFMSQYIHRNMLIKHFNKYVEEAVECKRDTKRRAIVLAKKEAIADLLKEADLENGYYTEGQRKLAQSYKMRHMWKQTRDK